MKIISWNVEWMNDWFVGGGAVGLRHNNAGRGIGDVNALATRVRDVIWALDVDVLILQEGPGDIREMELFVSNYLNNDYTDHVNGDGKSTLARRAAQHPDGTARTLRAACTLPRRKLRIPLAASTCPRGNGQRRRVSQA